MHTNEKNCSFAIERKQKATKKTKDSAACQKSVTFVLSVSFC
jgi:hypothetical protein